MILCYGSHRTALKQRLTRQIRYLSSEEKEGRMTPPQGIDYAKAWRSEESIAERNRKFNRARMFPRR